MKKIILVVIVTLAFASFAQAEQYVCQVTSAPEVDIKVEAVSYTEAVQKTADALQVSVKIIVCDPADKSSMIDS